MMDHNTGPISIDRNYRSGYSIMNAMFFIIFTLFLIVFQTIILPSFSFFIQCFDFMIINVLFLSLISTHYSTILLIIVIGIIMDSMSGVPFSYHLFSYLWTYILVSIFQQLFFQKSVVFLMVIGIITVAIQQGILLFSILLNSSVIGLLSFDFSLFIPQLFWAFVVIPPSIMCLEILYKRWKKMTTSIRSQWQKTREN